MNSAQAIICAIAVCVVVTCGSLTYGYLQNDESVINSDLVTQGETTMTTSGTCGTNLQWRLDDEGNLKIWGSGNMSNYSSTGCGPWGTAVKTITVDNAGSIGAYAFSGCTELTTLTVSLYLDRVSNYAFYGCTALKSVDLMGSVRSVSVIGAHAFDGCASLESITLPSALTSTGVGTGAFANCHALKSITASSNYKTVDGVLFNKDMTKLIAYPGGKQGAYSIPNTVTSFGAAAFEGCTSLTSLTIPESVTSLGGVGGDIDRAVFKNCTGLTDLTIPISVNAASWNNDPAFEGCTNIHKITFTPGTGVGVNYDNRDANYGFTPWAYSTSLETIIFSEGITSIGKYMFTGGRIGAVTEITIPSTVTSIGSSAFGSCTSLNTIYNQSSSLTLVKGSDDDGCVAKYAETLVQGDATVTLGRAASDSTQGTFFTLSVKPGETVILPEYTFITQESVSGTNKVTTITHTATGWTEQQ